MSTIDESRNSPGFKSSDGNTSGKATEHETAGRVTRQDHARHTTSRDFQYTTRSHKSIPSGLTGSPGRLDSAAEIYTQCHAWDGMSHE